MFLLASISSPTFFPRIKEYVLLFCVAPSRKYRSNIVALKNKTKQNQARKLSFTPPPPFFFLFSFFVLGDHLQCVFGFAFERRYG